QDTRVGRAQCTKTIGIRQPLLGLDLVQERPDDLLLLRRRIVHNEPRPFLAIGFEPEVSVPRGQVELHWSAPCGSTMSGLGTGGDASFATPSFFSMASTTSVRLFWRAMARASTSFAGESPIVRTASTTCRMACTPKFSLLIGTGIERLSPTKPPPPRLSPLQGPPTCCLRIIMREPRSFCARFSVIKISRAATTNFSTWAATETVNAPSFLRSPVWRILINSSRSCCEITEAGGFLAAIGSWLGAGGFLAAIGPWLGP